MKYLATSTWILIIAVCTCLFFFGKDKSIPKPHPFSQIVLMDTLDNELDFRSDTSLTFSDYYPIYIGEEKDSIQLTYKLRNHPFEYLYTPYDETSYPFPKKNDMTIFVDTTRLVGSGMNGSIPPPPPYLAKEGENYLEFEKWISKTDQRGDYLSYPVFLKNTSNDTINIAARGRILIRIQAKDSMNNWKNIQSHVRGCGNGIIYHYLPPQNIAITSANLYEGDYYTQLRLAFGYDPDSLLYSNEFWGNINYSQMETY